MKREDIHIVSRYSNWSAKSIQTTLTETQYNNKESWLKFLKLFFLSLGIGLTTAGILFFFAFNWADLHKFVKIGMVEGLILFSTLAVLFSKISTDTKNILLTATAILVGVLYAVFGQIYQTGANAYDFFLGWTLSITLWVAVSKFAPLWLVFITLVNTTLVLYSQQVAHDWSVIFVATVALSINICFFGVFVVWKKMQAPLWFNNLLTVALVTLATITICIGIFSSYENPFLVSILMVATLYIIGIKHAYKNKNTLYLALLFFSMIVMVSAFFLNASIDTFFIVCIIVIGSVSFLIKTLLDLQKKWKN